MRTQVESIDGDMNVGLLEALTKLSLAQLPDLTTFGEARNLALSIAVSRFIASATKMLTSSIKEANERERRSRIRTALVI